MPNERLLEYFKEDTNRRFDEMKDQLSSINASLDDLKAFRISLIAQSRLTAFIISAVCGFVTLVATLAVTFYIGK